MHENAKKLAKQWKESQEDLKIAAKLDNEDMDDALKRFKREYREKKKQITLKEARDSYY